MKARRLSLEEALEIRTLLAENYNCREIAREYDCSDKIVRRIKHGRWRPPAEPLPPVVLTTSGK